MSLKDLIDLYLTEQRKRIATNKKKCLEQFPTRYAKILTDYCNHPTMLDSELSHLLITMGNNLANNEVKDELLLSLFSTFNFSGFKAGLAKLMPVEADSSTIANFKIELHQAINNL